MIHLAKVIALFIVLYMYDYFSREEGQCCVTLNNELAFTCTLEHPEKGKGLGGGGIKGFHPPPW